MDYMEPTREKNELQGMLKRFQYRLIGLMMFLSYVIITQTTGSQSIFGVLLLGLIGYWCFKQVPDFSSSLDGLDKAYWDIVNYYERSKSQ